MPTATTSHIRLDERGVAWIDRTNTKVIEVTQDMIAHGWSPEEIHFQHPHLSLAQIHAALAFYYEVEKLRSQSGESPLRKRLREMGKVA